MTAANACPVHRAAPAEGTDALPARPFSDMPGEPGLPFFGSTLQYYRDPNALFERMYKKYGTVWRSRFLWMDYVAVCGPDADEYALMNRDKAFSNREGYEFPVGELFRGGLMLRDFEEHREHRLIMQVAFNREPMRQYQLQMNPDIRAIMRNWIPRYRNRARIHFYPKIKSTLLRLAVPVFVGERPNGKLGRALNRAITDVVNASGAFLRVDMPGVKYGRGMAGRRFLENYFRTRIDERRRSDRQDMFSQLCRAASDEGKRLDDEDIVNHMIFLIFAAHDTNTIAMTTTFYQLGRNPRLQDELREESLALGKRFLDYEDLDKLPGVDRVFKEAIRWVAPVPTLFRRTIQDCVVGGYTIPKGTMVLVNPQHTHRMEDVWRCPAEFDPDRFREDRREDATHKFAYFPFGGGVHKCLGRHFAENQAKAVLHQALQSYKWEVPANAELDLDYSSMPKPRDGLPITFTRLAGAG